MKRFFLFLLLISISSCQANENKSDKNNEGVNYTPTQDELIFLDSLQYRSFLYFINEINPENGLVKDRSSETSPASIAAMGFAIPVWAIGAENGWMTKDEAAAQTLRMLQFLFNSEQSTDVLATGYQGFYYHFLDMKTGEREWECELSTIDTALLLAGVRFATQYYSNDMPDENKIRDLADSITNRINWDFTTLPDSGRFKNTVSMGWHPETDRLHTWGWVGFNEALLLYILAAGSGYSDYQQAYDQWLSNYEWDEPYNGLAHAVFPPLFGHQYSHMFIDFRGVKDKYLKEKGIDYFENSRRAVYTQRQYAIDNPLGWKGYDSLTWGLTACDGPGPDYNFDGKQFRHYSARGTSGPNRIQDDDGTIAPTAAGGSVPFAPEIVIPTLKAMYDRYSEKGLWGPYGFYDAFNPTLNWFNSDYIGIDQGPIVIMIENYKNNFVWDYMMKDEIIKTGMQKLGFSKSN
jgi:hypothetical protein